MKILSDNQAIKKFLLKGIHFMDQTCLTFAKEVGDGMLFSKLSLILTKTK